MSRPQSAESVFRAIAHPTRRRIIEMLRQGERAADELLEHPRLTKPTLSMHLRVLREAGLIAHRRRGTSLHYRLNMAPLNGLFKWTDRLRLNALRT